MRPLNVETANQMHEILKNESSLILYEQESGTVLTNGQILLEWRQGGSTVDRKCPSYLRMIGRQKGAEGLIRRLENEPWRDVILDPNGKFVPAEEVEPNVKERHIMKKDGDPFQIFRAVQGNLRFGYRCPYMELVEYLSPEPTFSFYLPPNASKLDIARVLVASENDNFIGLIMNRRM
jgi:hypothetical protein